MKYFIYVLLLCFTCQIYAQENQKKSWLQRIFEIHIEKKKAKEEKKRRQMEEQLKKLQKEFNKYVGELEESNLSIDENALLYKYLDGAYHDFQISPTISAQNFTDIPALIKQLQTQKDPLGKYLMQKFIASANAKDKKLNQISLIAFFKQILHSQDLYQKQRFAHIKLSSLTQKLLSQKPKGKQLWQLNYRLLQEAYPEKIHKWEDVKSKLPKDPWGNPYIYKELEFDIYSLDADNKDQKSQDSDDITTWTIFDDKPKSIEKDKDIKKD